LLGIAIDVDMEMVNQVNFSCVVVLAIYCFACIFTSNSENQFTNLVSITNHI